MPGRVADGISRGVEGIGDAVSGAFEPTVRLGVTGLARAGKTVFVTSLVANLLDRGRMPQLRAAADGGIRAVHLRPQPDDTVPRFPFERNLAALTGPDPGWPEATSSISELRLSMKVRPGGPFGAFRGDRTLHLDIVDYPGEWLLDLQLVDASFDGWSARALGLAETRPMAEEFLRLLHGVDADARFDEESALKLAEAWTSYLRAAKASGMSDCTPGRFILPGDLAGSPALTFAPLGPGKRPRGSLGREMERRFEAYKARVARPFFRDHFSRIDRQIVLADVLGAVDSGPESLEDLRRSLAGVLGAFRPGRKSWLSRLLRRRVERILFAATKADHLHHVQHGKLTALVEALLREAKGRADLAGAGTAAMSIASLRATVEERIGHGGSEVDVVAGTLLETGRRAAFHPGDLPDDPGILLAPAREGARRWPGGDWRSTDFAPARLTLRPGDGPPHIRLDRAAEFLIGDRLR